MTALLRVSVVAGTRRVDLAVPPVLPVAELVPGLARRLGVVSYDGLRLCTVDGTALDDAAGLAPQEVADGTVLCLAPPPPEPVVQDDPAEALAAAAPPPAGPPSLPARVGVVLLLLGAAVAAQAGATREAAAVGLVMLAVALVLGRVSPEAGVVLAVGASGYAAAAAGLVVAGTRPGTGPVWAAAGGAGIAVASLAMAGLPRHRLMLLPVLVVAAGAAVIGAALVARPVPVTVPACALLAADVVLAAGLPWLAAGRISGVRVRVDPARLAAETRLARDLLGGLAGGLAILQVALTPVVAHQGPTGIALAGCASAFVLLGAHGPAGPATLTGRVAGGLGLLLTVAVALGVHPDWRPVGSAMLAGAGGVLLAAPLLGEPGPVVRAVRGSLGSVLLVALLPLVVVTTGLLDALQEAVR